MGCTQSKIENEETVNRCKERRRFMERAVMARNKFAAAHTAHAMSLKNTGAALSDFAEGEVYILSTAVDATTAAALSNSGATLPPPLPPDENFPPPPPPLPSSFNNLSPLQRATTMPEFSAPRPENKPSNPVIEEENEEDAELESTYNLKRRSSKTSGGGGGIRSAVLLDGAVEEERMRQPQGLQGLQHPPPPMPEIKGMSSWDYFFSIENVPGPMMAEVEENQVESVDMERRVLEERSRKMEVEETPRRSEKAEAAEVLERASELPPEPPHPEATIEATNIVKRVKQGVQAEGKKKSGTSNVNLEKIFVDLDDCFLKASESAHEVSRMLEATRFHYHSNFADKRGHINHSERVLRVITWNRSFRGLPNADDGMDDFDSEENETHATVLDKMLAWEKKLYEEVKAGEQMKLEYQKKVASLNKLKKRGSNTDALERMKASVSLLHTRYIVDMQSMDSTVSEINRLRDEQLYPKLVSLVDGMATMWEIMREHHESQSKIVQSLRLLDISHSPKETSDHHHERTRQLCGVVQEWHMNFSALMTQQKEYMKALNGWLKLNLVPIDTSLKEKVTSPSRPQNPPILMLLHAWYDFLEKLPDEPAKSTIDNFAAIIQTIWQHQKEELDFRNKCADSRKEYIKKTRDFENWYNKYLQKRMPSDETDPDPAPAQDKDIIAERQLAVEAAKKKVEDDEEAYQRQCIHVREKSLMSLKGHLPVLFRALSDFALACSDMYRNLRSIAQLHNRRRADVEV
ncbi:LOW QUALITY PROTEIN: protein ROLLING AND ERECT LEAF 2-like [Primulina tabacum]|uniref:LOW QUALITY PROTEIN: protein ROLLING AND ERECT LEAF 2-like n=1 Tax=Primulina tabacum TaxID=48773 RepID=UPI003F59DD47